MTKEELERGHRLRGTARWVKWVWANINDLMAQSLDCLHQRYLVQELTTDIGLRDLRIAQLETQLKLLTDQPSDAPKATT